MAGVSEKLARLIRKSCEYCSAGWYETSATPVEETSTKCVLICFHWGPRCLDVKCLDHVNHGHNRMSNCIGRHLTVI